MLGWVANTDRRWYESLRRQPGLTEVNFWRPSPQRGPFPELLEAASFSERAKRVAILRMVPVVERNYNLVELGPRGTGKSHLFQRSRPTRTSSRAARRRSPRCS